MENINNTPRAEASSSIEKLFEPDPRWSIFEGAGSFIEFQKNFLFSECLHSNADKPLLEQEILINKLLTYGYFEYEFITVAIRNSFLMFELGLKIYYKKFTGTDFQGQLYKLIEAYEKLSIINGENRLVLDMIRHVRNHFTHPKEHTVVAPAVIEIIKLVVTIINDLEKILSERN